MSRTNPYFGYRTFASTLFCFAISWSCVLGQTSYYGVVKDRQSGQPVNHVRVDAMYTPFTFLEMEKPNITLASTYTDAAGAFSLVVPATARHTASFLSADKIESERKLRLNGWVTHPRKGEPNVILVSGLFYVPIEELFRMSAERRARGPNPLAKPWLYKNPVYIPPEKRRLMEQEKERSNDNKDNEGPAGNQ